MPSMVCSRPVGNRKRNLSYKTPIPAGRIDREDFRNLRQFKEEHPETELIFLYPGEQRFLEGGIEIVPVELFLQDMEEFI